MAEGGDYKSLIVWQKSIALVRLTYTLTSNIPPEEKFGLISQMRRAAVSIPSNIAEGQARRTTGDYIRFVSTAEGSLAELDTQFTIAVELGSMDPTSLAECVNLMGEVRKMLNALRRSLLNRSSRQGD
jgi:four helix bundle protein